jgi:hypothetical protein
MADLSKINFILLDKNHPASWHTTD